MGTSQIYIYIKKNKGRPEMTKKKKNLIKIHKWVFEKTKKIKKFHTNLDFEFRFWNISAFRPDLIVRISRLSRISPHLTIAKEKNSQSRNQELDPLKMERFTRR